LAASTVADAEDTPRRAPPATPGKLQDIPLPGSTVPSEGVRIQERRIWRKHPEGKPARDLEVKIGRIWSEGKVTLARVIIRNSSSYDLDEINLRCQALTGDGRELGFQEQSFRTTESVPIRAGYTKEIDVTIDRSGAKVGSMSCNARGF
jgi:hypothetical protein